MTRTLRGILQDVRDMNLWQSLVLLAAGAVSAIFAMWFIDTRTPVNVISAVATTPRIAPGEQLMVHYEVDRERSCPVKLDRLIYDAKRVRYTLEDQDLAAAPWSLGRDDFSVPVFTPRGLAQGKATYVVVSSYACNLLQRVWPIVTRTEIKFEVAGTPTEGQPVEVMSVR